MQIITAAPKIDGSILLLTQISFDVQIKCYRRCMQKTHNFIKKIFYWLFQALLIVFFPTFYAIGFVGGILANAHMNAALERIKKIWNATSRGILLIIGIGAFLSLPITLATTAWAFGTQLSNRLIRKLTPTPSFQSEII